MNDAAITEYCVDRVRGTRVPLSHRIRPNCEAAPWVVEEVRTLEAELIEARAAVAELIEARAAVAELLEAAGDMPVEYDFHGNPATPEWGRLVAALARCKEGV